MSFLTVVKMRDDGDYDVFASFNIDALDESVAIEWVLQCHEFLEEAEEGDDTPFNIIHVANVTSIIEAEYMEVDGITRDITEKLREAFLTQTFPSLGL